MLPPAPAVNVIVSVPVEPPTKSAVAPATSGSGSSAAETIFSTSVADLLAAVPVP